MASFQINLAAIRRNAEILQNVAQASGARVVLALKGFSTWAAFDVLKPYLSGCCASGLWEAELAHDTFGGHILTYSPAYPPEDMDRLMEISSHIDFNSISQWNLFKDKIKVHPRFLSGDLKCGLRVNPQCSTGHTPLYDPCVVGSRLGSVADDVRAADERGELDGLSGIHFHTLCEQDSDDLEKTLVALKDRFGWLLSRPEMTWVNCGGGHWITKPTYDRERLVRLLKEVRAAYDVDVWIEPGEAVAIHTGVLRARVLDVFTSCGVPLALLDISVSAHLPDVLEMPYRPDIFLVDSDDGSERVGSQPAVIHEGEMYTGAQAADELPYTYRLGACTCLAGDVVGDFSFPRPLQVGDILVFDDMSHYTMVKTTFFNGVKHPNIELVDEAGSVRLAREFTYTDFKNRLG